MEESQVGTDAARLRNQFGAEYSKKTQVGGRLHSCTPSCQKEKQESEEGPWIQNRHLLLTVPNLGQASWSQKRATARWRQRTLSELVGGVGANWAAER